jgi:hypothetical protein
VGWKLDVPGLPEGYHVIEAEDGITLMGPQGIPVAHFGPMVSSLEAVVAAAWEDVRAGTKNRMQPA